MTDRRTMPSAMPADLAEVLSDLSFDVSEEIEAAPAPIPDDTVYRMALIEYLDRHIQERNRMLNPKNAFYWSDTAVLAQLKRVREFVVEMEEA
jgi:hypothetical protein